MKSRHKRSKLKKEAKMKIVNKIKYGKRQDNKAKIKMVINFTDIHIET